MSARRQPGLACARGSGGGRSAGRFWQVEGRNRTGEKSASIEGSWAPAVGGKQQSQSVGKIPHVYVKASFPGGCGSGWLPEREGWEPREPSPRPRTVLPGNVPHRLAGGSGEPVVGCFHGPLVSAPA